MLERKEKTKLFMSRFYSRQDVYGRAWESTDKDGRLIKGYAPVCDNFWTDVCHIKRKDGKTCSNCVNKRYTPVSEDSVWKHISGEEAHTYYLLQQDGTVKFMAMDFDCKVGKEDKGYKFEDVRTVSDFLKQEGIPHGIARSTTNGFHLYIFISDFYKAVKAKALMFWIFERVGFFEQMRQGTRPIPEAFPKNNHPGFGIGNGIKPGMIESQFAKERNGFVDGNGYFIPAHQQWTWFQNIPDCTTKQLDDLIDKYGIEFEDDTEEAEVGTGYRRDLARSHHSKKGAWQPPLTGSMEKVIEGCAALRVVAGKCKEGTVLGHQEGFALFHLAMHTMDGLEWFKKNVPGWGETDKDMRQLEHSLEKNYLPPSCAKLQELGVCPIGKKCFDPKPPLVLVEGQYVVDDKAPPAAPSPIRYAFGKGEDFLEKLKAEIDVISNEPDENKKGNGLRAIAKRAQVFDEDQQRILKDYVKSKKILKAPEVGKIFDKAGRQHSNEIREKASCRSDTAQAGDNVYSVSYDPPGYSLMKRTKDGVEYVRISDCIIEIEEEKHYLDDDDVILSVFKGVFRASKFTTSFEMELKAWNDNKEFSSKMVSIAGTKFNVLRQDLDHFKQAIIAFSDKGNIKKVNNMVTQGWYQDTYLMPSVLVDKDGVRPNTEKVIDLTSKTHSSYLDFKILPEEELREVIAHLIHDFLNAWPRKWTMIALAHSLMPPVLGPMRLRKKPALFFEGLTGSGKTELLHASQYMWGEFDAIMNLTSTGKGIAAVAHDFKDAFLVLDDYKGLDASQIHALQRVIQYSYEPNSSVKMNRDSSLMKPKQARGLIGFTGENFIQNDAAMVARTILIEVDKQDTSKTREKYNRVLAKRSQYSGVTPHFIHWFLNQDKAMIASELSEITRTLYENKGAVQNADRVSYNLGVNHLVWRMFVTFVNDMGICTNEERSRLIDEHLTHAFSVQNEMLSRCADEQNGQAFLEVLVQLVSSNELLIKGFNDGGDEKSNKPIIGYVSKNEYGLQIANIFPGMAVQYVKNRTNNSSPIRGTEREFSRQFYDAGMLVDVDKGRWKKQTRFNGVRTYVWPFNMRELGLDTGLSCIQGGDFKQKVPNEDLPDYGKADGTTF